MGLGIVMNGFFTFVNALNHILGRIGIWAVAFMVIVQFFVVLFRYVFSISEIWIQESIIYAFAVMFLLSSALAYSRDLHVRIDILSNAMSDRTRAMVEMLGIVLLLMPTCFVIVFYSWDYVGQSWAVRETSIEADGIPFVYLLKTLLLIFPIQLALQGLVQLNTSYQHFKNS